MELIQWSCDDGNIHAVFKPTKPIDDLSDKEAIRIIRTLIVLSEGKISRMLQENYVRFALNLKEYFSI